MELWTPRGQWSQPVASLQHPWTPPESKDFARAAAKSPAATRDERRRPCDDARAPSRRLQDAHGLQLADQMIEVHRRQLRKGVQQIAARKARSIDHPGDGLLRAGRNRRGPARAGQRRAPRRTRLRRHRGREGSAGRRQGALPHR